VFCKNFLLLFNLSVFVFFQISIGKWRNFNIKGIQNLHIFSLFCSGQVGTKLVEEMGILDFFKTLIWKITELWNFFDRVGILKFSWIFNVGFHGSLENRNFEIFLVAFSQIFYLKMPRSFSRIFKFRFFDHFVYL